MTEYLVIPLSPDHIEGQSAAEDAAAEIAAETKEPVGVYVLVTTVYP